MITAIKIENDTQWRSLRAAHIGGSQVAILFGEDSRTSRYQLWMQKADRMPEPDLSDNDRVMFGELIEPAIGEAVARRKGWTVRKVHRYFSNPDIGLGGTLDFQVNAKDGRGWGVLETKCVDWLVWKDWEDGQPPVSYQLQAQAYMALSGFKWSTVAALVGGNTLRLYEYEFRPQTVAIIEREVAAFWQSIRDNKPPPPDFTQDGETIRRLYASAAAGKTIDLTGSNRAPQLIADYVRGRDMEKEGATIKDAAKAELLPLMGDAERATCGLATISAKMIGAKHIEYDRAAYRDFRVNVKEPKV